MGVPVGRGWFPRISETGMIACGNVTVGVLLTDGRWVEVGPGNTPLWCGSARLVWNHEKLTCFASIVEGTVSDRFVLDTGGFNAMSAAENGLWYGFRPPSNVTMGDRDGVKRDWSGIGLVALSPDGTQTAYIDRPQANIKTLYLNNRAVVEAEVLEYALSNGHLVWIEATGTYTRRVRAVSVAAPQTIIECSVRAWEGAARIVDTPRGPWVVTGAQEGGLLVRPAGSSQGVLVPGEWYFPDARMLNGQIVLVGSDARGDARRADVPLSSSRMDLREAPPVTPPAPPQTPIPTPPVSPPSPPSTPPVAPPVPPTPPPPAPVVPVVPAVPVRASVEDVAQVLAGAWFERISSKLGLSAAKSTAERRASVHAWILWGCEQADAVYRTVFDRPCDLEGFGAAVEQFLMGVTVAQFEDAKRAAYKRGER